MEDNAAGLIKLSETHQALMSVKKHDNTCCMTKVVGSRQVRESFPLLFGYGYFED